MQRSADAAAQRPLFGPSGNEYAPFLRRAHGARAMS